MVVNIDRLATYNSSIPVKLV